VGDTGVSVGGTGVLVGGTGTSVGGTGVSVAGSTESAGDTLVGVATSGWGAAHPMVVDASIQAMTMAVSLLRISSLALSLVAAPTLS